MLKKQIEDLKSELNILVNEGLHSEKVYRLSTELDKLINRHYRERNIMKC